MDDWSQLIASIGVTMMAVASFYTIVQHNRMIKQMQEFLVHERATLDLLESGIKLMMVLSGVEVVRGGSEPPKEKFH